MATRAQRKSALELASREHLLDVFKFADSSYPWGPNHARDEFAGHFERLLDKVDRFSPHDQSGFDRKLGLATDDEQRIQREEAAVAAAETSANASVRSANAAEKSASAAEASVNLAQEAAEDSRKSGRRAEIATAITIGLTILTIVVQMRQCSHEERPGNQTQPSVKTP